MSRIDPIPLTCSAPRSTSRLDSTQPQQPPSSGQPPHTQRGFVLIGVILLIIIFACLLALGMYMIKLDKIVRSKFEGKRWEIPAKVYARPMELFNGATLKPTDLSDELKMLNYRKADGYQSAGTWTSQGSIYYVHTRGFDFGDSFEPEQVLKVTFDNGSVIDIQSSQQTGTGIARLEPIVIGGIYPRHNEDRVLIQLGNVPQTLIDALVATEDRQFYQHHGISVRGTARAILSNVTGGARQGGSTLTQQLVKNFYLTPERTLKRKANEALMAILLEQHYSKNDILETYLNEINLGQNGNHSINGFGLASQFYFGQPLRELKLHQVALLVGLVKGPSQYNPWRNPEQSLARRNVVLDNMVAVGKLSPADAAAAKEKPISILKKPTAGKSLFPDFLDVVRRQLAEQYQERDLQSSGLRIFSSLDPHIQQAANQAFESSVNRLVKANPKKLTGLQGAVLVANPQNGELLAVVGGSGLFTGFNRALDAHRQVGSLLKPAVYLTALQSQRYTLASLIDDGPISVTGMGMEDWQPKNYDHRDHGIVPLYDALAHSYNQATVRIGWEMGVPSVINTLRQLGIREDLPQYPSILLGAANLSPMDVLGMYQVYAAGGFGHPTTAIRTVVDSDGTPLQRFGLTMRQQIDPSSAYLINYAMQQVVAQGTARSVLGSLSPDLNLAGKTGTTNDLRDAWFAGYSGNYVSVVWLGHDDNRPTGLSGSSGALPVWTDLMKRLPQTPVELPTPADIQWQWVDATNGLVSSENCANSVFMPFIFQTLPRQLTPCAYDRYMTQQRQAADAMANQRSWTEDASDPSYTPPAPAEREPAPRDRSTWLDRALEAF
jgi:penicillin-binding protein 1B